MNRITLDLDDKTLDLLDRLAAEYLPKQELNQYQWLHQTKEGSAFWHQLTSNQTMLSSMSSKEIGALIAKKFREHCPPTMGRPAVAKARSAALKALLDRTLLQEAA